MAQSGCLLATVCDPAYGSVPLSCAQIVDVARRQFADPAACNVMACIAAGCPQGCACYPVNGGAYGLWGIAPQQLSANSSVCPSNVSEIVRADVNAACAARILAQHGVGAWAACTPPANNCSVDFRATGCWCDLFPPTTASSSATTTSTTATTMAASTAASSTSATVADTSTTVITVGSSASTTSTVTSTVLSTTGAQPPPTTVHIDGTVRVDGDWIAGPLQVTIFGGNASTPGPARLTVTGTAVLAGSAVIDLSAPLTDTRRVRLVLASAVSGSFVSVKVRGPPGDCMHYEAQPLSLPTLYAANVVASPGVCPVETDRRFIVVGAVLGGVFAAAVSVAGVIVWLENYRPDLLPSCISRVGRLKPADLQWR